MDQYGARVSLVRRRGLGRSEDEATRAGLVLAVVLLAGCRLQVPFVDLELGSHDRQPSEREIKDRIDREVDRRVQDICLVLKQYQDVRPTFYCREQP